MKEDRVEENVRSVTLYDFYGELLNPHQKKIFESAYFMDLSLSEIAEEEGTTRQAVHIALKNCTKKLEAFEKKIGMMDKFFTVEKKTAAIKSACSDSAVQKLCDEIIEVF